MRSLFTPGRSLPATLGAAVFGAGLLASLLSAPRPAHAAGACRSDPIVTLSNGLAIHLSATVYDTPSDITAITYTLRAPVGTSVVSVVYPPDPNNIPQAFSFAATNPAGVWDSYTYVDTKTTGIGVTATAEVANLAVFSANGSDHQQVQVHVQQGGQGGGDGTTPAASSPTVASAPSATAPAATGGKDRQKDKKHGGDNNGNNGD